MMNGGGVGSTALASITRWSLSVGHRREPEGGPAAPCADPPRDQALAAGHRERPLPGQEAHAAGGLLPGLSYGPAHDPGLRSHAVAAQGLRVPGGLMVWTLPTATTCQS